MTMLHRDLLRALDRLLIQHIAMAAATNDRGRAEQLFGLLGQVHYLRTQDVDIDPAAYELLKSMELVLSQVPGREMATC